MMMLAFARRCHTLVTIRLPQSLGLDVGYVHPAASLSQIIHLYWSWSCCCCVVVVVVVVVVG